MSVQLYRVGAAPRPGGEAAHAAQAFVERGATAHGLPDRLPSDAHLVVDALLGTGLDRPLAGEFEAAVRAINHWSQTASGGVQALDIPTGLNADSGAVTGACVHADQTVAFIGLNRGLMTGAAVDHRGELVCEGLDLPAAVYEALPPAAGLATWETMRRAWLPARRPSTHKGDAGRVLVVGGNHGYGGAARLAGEAAQRAGAGLVTVATRQEQVPALVAGRPELMVRGVRDAGSLRPLLDSADVVAIGPGLGQDAWAEALLGAVLDCQAPVVVDADALNLLARRQRHRGNWVLTPHPGEAARLLGSRVAAVQADRFAAADQLVERYGGVVLLKGPGTLAATQGPLPTLVCAHGNPGLASGGTGDVLTGVVAGLVAQGLELFQAAILGATAHGRAAELAAGAGERGMIASDLFGPLRRILNGLDGAAGACDG